MVGHFRNDYVWRHQGLYFAPIEKMGHFDLAKCEASLSSTSH